MKKLIFFLLLPVFAWGQPYRILMVKTNGELASPTNFWDVNASSILDALDLSSDSVTTNDARRLQFTNPTNQFIGVFTGNGNGLTNLSLVAILAAFPSGVSNYDTRALSFTNPANQLVGVFSGNGANLTNLPIPSGLLSNYYVLPVVLNDSLSLSNGNIGFTNYSGTATLYMSSPNGGGLGSIAFNGAYTFVGSGGIQANQFVGSGTGLTSVPANQLSGTVPMANLDARVVTNNGYGDVMLGLITNKQTTIYKASPTANELLLLVATSDDANRFSVDEDGDVNVDGNMTLQNIVASRFLALNGSKIVQAGGDSAALANSISDETGSGAAVFATSPTFPGIITINGITLTNPVPSVLAISATGIETNASLAVSNLIVRGNIMAQQASGVLILGNGWGGGSITIDTTDIRPTTPGAMALGRWNYPYSAAYSSGVVMSTNRNVANPTYLLMDGSRTTAGNVIDYTTNNVSKFSVDTTGAMTVGSTLNGNGTIIGNAGFRAPGANVLSSADCFLGHGIRRYNPASGLTFAFGESTAVGTVGFEILPVSGTTASTNLLMIYRDSARTMPVFGVTSNGAVSASGGYYFPTNPISAWPTAPRTPGEVFWGNSNGVQYQLSSGRGLTWLSTNQIGAGPQ